MFFTTQLEFYRALEKAEGSCPYQGPATVTLDRRGSYLVICVHPTPPAGHDWTPHWEGRWDPRHPSELPAWYYTGVIPAYTPR